MSPVAEQPEPPTAERLAEIERLIQGGSSTPHAPALRASCPRCVALGLLAEVRRLTAENERQAPIVAAVMAWAAARDAADEAEEYDADDHIDLDNHAYDLLELIRAAAALPGVPRSNSPDAGTSVPQGGDGSGGSSTGPSPSAAAPGVPEPDEMAALQAELDDLERTDPDVAAAAANYDRTVRRIVGDREPCPTCDGNGCEEGCGRRGGCEYAYAGPDSHRICRRCKGRGTVVEVPDA